MLPEVVVDLDWRGKRYQDIERGLLAIADDFDKKAELIGPIVKKTLRDYMKAVLQSVRERVSTPYPSGTSPAGEFPGRLSKRSGRLLASFSDTKIGISRTKDPIEVTFRLDGIGLVHEKGATIYPKRAKWLTVPLPAALNPNGTPKKPTARDWQNTFVLKSKKGNLLIVQRNGKDITPLYVLKKSVTIPKRLAFEEAFLAGRDFLADKIAQDVVREFFR
jgi:hypothetical protein